MIIDNPFISGSLNVQNDVTASNIHILGTASAVYFTGSFVGDGTQLSGVTSYTDQDTLDYINTLGVLSGSAQIASDISGSFTSLSSSLQQRISSQENFSSSLDATFATDQELSDVSGALAASIAGISTDFADITNKPTLISSSAQLASDISGSFTSVSESFASDRLKNTTDTLTGDLTVTGKITAQEFHTEFVSASIIYQSGSTQFGDTLDDTHTFTGSVNLTGSLFVNGSEVGTGKLDESVFNSYTSSTDTRLDTAEGSISSLNSATASYALEANISGAFADTSASLAQRVSAQEDFSSSLDATFATDADLNLVSSSVDALNAATSSYALQADISGAFASTSSSLAQRITSQESFSSSLDTALLTLSGSFSGSFVGDGSQLSGVTSYTDSDTLAFINSIEVLSGSIAELTAVTASFLNTGSVTIPHSFNSKNVSVQVYDSNDIYIIPQEIALVSNNAVKLTFAGNTSGFAVVAKGGHIVSGSVPVPQLSTVASTFSSTTSHTVTHNFNTKEVIVSVYENDSLIIPDTVTTDDVNNVTVTFPEAISGRVVVVKAGHIVSGSIPFDNLLDSPFDQSVSAITASKHIVPSQDQTYDLGSSDLRFRDLYLSSASIFLGNTVISEDNVVTTASLVTALPANVVSSSAQLASDISGSFTSVSASIASDLVSNYLRNTSDTLDGDLTVTGKITAQEFHTEFVSASIIYQSGSTQFGNSVDDVHQFTGTGSFDIIGVNTPNPAAQLHVYQPSGQSGIRLTRGNNITGVNLSLSVDSSKVRIGGYGDALAFFTAPVGDGTNASERLRIDSSGNVGIGTTVPSYKLDVVGNARFDDNTPYGGLYIIGDNAPALTIIDGSSTAESKIWGQSTASIQGVLVLSADDNNIGTSSSMQFRVDSTERMRIDSTGFVGIGTSTPSAALNISGTGDSSSKITIQRIGAIPGITVLGYNYVGTFDGSDFRVFANSGERMRITNAGNVGIGTTSPTSKLAVSGDIYTSGQFAQGVAIADKLVNYGAEFRSNNASAQIFFGRSGDNVGTSAIGGDATYLLSVWSNDFSRPFNILRDGNVGIGTTNPGVKLSVAAPAGATGELLLQLYKSGGFGATEFYQYYNSTSDYGINFGLAVSSDTGGRAGISFKSTTGGSGNIVFTTTNTEWMRINNTGEFLINKTTFTNAGAGLILRSDGTSGGNIRITRENNTSTQNHVPFFSNSGTVIGTITTTTTSTAYNTSSDYRLKENVVSLTGALNRVNSLKPSRFNFIADPDKVVDGFLAHEVQSIVPEAITGEKDAVDEERNPEYQGIDQSKLVPLLTAAIQEQQAQIEELKAEIQALKNA